MASSSTSPRRRARGNLALIVMALSILIGGAGALSIDRLIAPLGE
jgi:uncharacterized membrane protein YphA (DoxX/SURF4 family)